MTTTAVMATTFGAPEDALRVIEHTVSPPAAGEALVEVRAAGVNPIDWRRYSGALGRDPSLLPMPLGSEIAGVVSEVGSEAVGPAGPIGMGQEVIGYRVAGGYTKRLVVPAAALVPKPRALSWAEAAGLMLTGATAIHALEAVGAAPGETLLVHGASGSVGRAIIQIARHQGIQVLGTAGAARLDVVRSLGAQPTTYGPGLQDRLRQVAPEGVDAAIDLAGTDEAIDTSLSMVGDRRRVATLVGFARGAQVGIKLLGGAPGADPGQAIREAARLRLADLAERGVLRVETETYALDDAALAHRAGIDGTANGKLVLVP